MRRKSLSLVAALLLVLITSALPASARQEATPISGFADLGLPTLDVSITAASFEGVPDQLEAGRYLVTVTAAEDTEFGGGIAFVQPAEMSVEEFLGAMSGPPEGADGGTPMAASDSTLEMDMAMDGTPMAGGDEMGGPPAFVFDATYAGGTFAEPGDTAHVVLDLTPGEWLVWGDDPFASQEPLVLDVTGEMPTDLPEPESSATIVMSEFAIDVAVGELIAGPQVIRIDNTGAQPHFIFFAQIPDGVTEDQIGVSLNEEMAAEMTGEDVVYSDFNPNEDPILDGFSATQSMGTTLWITLDLEPGTHAMICFFPGLDGVPHAYNGMYAIVEVTA